MTSNRAISLSALSLGSSVAMLVLAWPQPAAAFRCARVLDGSGAETGPALSWFKRTIPYSLFAAGTADIAGDQELVVLRASFAAWEGIEDCRTPRGTSDLHFEETPYLSTVDRIGYDFRNPEENENLLIFRDAGWPFDDSFIALTTTTYKPLTGEILDADIEFNTAQFPFGIDGATDKMDLMNAAVHEIGHVFGLGHSDVMGATMDSQGHLGETEKRTPECDDRNAVVFKYPAGGANGYCASPTSSCGYCALPDELDSTATVTLRETSSGCSGGVVDTALLLVVVPLLVSALARRRRLASIRLP